MNLNSLDLNLLVALDALLREANVSRAAMRIGLSQPAASHALQRLREVLGDPLLVRVGARMELTPRALGLRGPLAQALDQVRGLFIPDDFDAASSERRFRLMMPDLAVELLVPPLMAATTASAELVMSTLAPWSSDASLPNFAATGDPVRIARNYDTATLARLGTLSATYDPQGVLAVGRLVRAACL